MNVAGNANLPRDVPELERRATGTISATEASSGPIAADGTGVL